MKNLVVFVSVLLMVSVITTVSHGAEYWAKTYGADNNSGELIESQIQQTTDGGYILAGRIEYFEVDPIVFIDKDAFVVKLDRNGDVTWQKTYGGNDSDIAYAIQETAEGGYILAGSSASFGIDFDLWILKLGSDGYVTWQKTYDAGAYDSAHSIQQTTDGGYIVAGGNGSGILILKLENDGDVTWQNTYRIFVNQGVGSIKQTIDGGYIIAGSTDGGGNNDVLILKLDSSGNVTWQKSYERDGYLTRAREIQQTVDGGYIVAVQSTELQNANADIWIFKLESDGDVTWQKTYGGNDNEYYPSIRQTVDGGYIMSCMTRSFGTDFDAWVLKLEGNGNITWQKTYGWADTDAAYRIEQTSDGGYIVAGYTNSFGSIFTDLLIIKIDGNGVIPDCDIINTTNASVSDTSVVVQANSVTIASPSVNITDTNAIPQNSSLQLTTSCFYSETDTDEDGIPDYQDNCPNDYNPNQEDADGSGIGDACNDAVDADGDEWEDNYDNCPNHPNAPELGTCIHGTIGTTCTSNEECDITGGDGFCSMNQEDNYPPNGNGIGDACECEGDFDRDGDVDAADVMKFLEDFGRSQFFNPCP